VFSDDYHEEEASDFASDFDKDSFAWKSGSTAGAPQKDTRATSTVFTLDFHGGDDDDDLDDNTVLGDSTMFVVDDD